MSDPRIPVLEPELEPGEPGSRPPGHRAFDHRESGTDEAVWATTDVLDEAAPLDLAGFSEVVVVAAHPDDESLGAGGLLAAATALHLPVTVLIATFGERSHPQSTTHPPEALRTLRRAELFRALDEVAPTASVRTLGLSDGELTAHQTELTAAIRPVVRGRSTLVVAPWRGDGHPDHQAAGNAAASATVEAGATLLEYPIWAWHWADPGDLPAELVRLDLAGTDVDAKRRAVHSHRSQTEPLSDLLGDEAVVPAGFAAHFERTFEIFVGTSRTATSPATAATVATATTTAPATTVATAATDAIAAIGSLPGDFFDDFYGSDADPWGFESRWYERRKRALTMASLPRERFARAFEPGCSIGVLTAELAARCDEILATDIALAPLRRARRRLADEPRVRFQQMRIPQEWPIEVFDLIVLSEVGYYCGPADLASLLAQSVSSLTPDGVLIGCHWRHSVPEYPLSGDDVHRALRSQPGLALQAEHREEDFLLDVYARPPAVSVARATGLLP